MAYVLGRTRMGDADSGEQSYLRAMCNDEEDKKRLILMLSAIMPDKIGRDGELENKVTRREKRIVRACIFWVCHAVVTRRNREDNTQLYLQTPNVCLWVGGCALRRVLDDRGSSKQPVMKLVCDGPCQVPSEITRSRRVWCGMHVWRAWERSTRYTVRG